MPRTISDSTPQRNIHIRLHDDLYRALQVEAAQSKQPASAVAREAIAQWLEARRQARIDEAVLAYALAVVGTTDDLDLDLEAAGLALLEEDACGGVKSSGHP